MHPKDKILLVSMATTTVGVIFVVIAVLHWLNGELATLISLAVVILAFWVVINIAKDLKNL